MSGFRFPFEWGSVGVTSVVTSASTARWTTVGATSEVWQIISAGRHRFERIYATPVSTFGQSVNFSYEIRSQFPLVLSSDQQAVITSTITNP